MAQLQKAPRRNALSRFLCINALRFFWIVVLIWGELGAFYWSLRHCRWPGSRSSGESASETKDKSTSRVLLLSDTQVQHPALQTGHEPWTAGVRRFFNDLNLKKSWHVTSQLKPDVIVFLGDMLANGRNAKDEKRYFMAVEKFKSIFSASVPVYYAPGNNDIWLGEITPYAKAIRRYYTESFGPPSQTFDVQNHTFVILDAPGLVDEDYLRSGKGVSFSKWKPLPDGAISFVENIVSNQEASTKKKNPIILLSHIPLSRPEMANCGPLRERGTLRRNVGHGYQSMLGRQTTSFLLQNGDNRDYCEHSHTIADDVHSIREVTLKSFSPSAHIRRPGFQLLSVTAPSSSESESMTPSPTGSQQQQRPATIADVPCFLPDQSQIYTHTYLPTLCFTFLFLAVFNFRASKRSLRGSFTSPSSTSSPLVWRRPTPLRTGSLPSSRSVSARSTPAPSPRIVSHPGFNLPPASPLRPAAKRLSSFGSRPGTPGARSARPSFEDGDREGAGGVVTDDEEDEDLMQPAQYATVRHDLPSVMPLGSGRYGEDAHDEDAEWSDVGGSVGRDLEGSYDFGGTSVTASESSNSALLLSPPVSTDSTLMSPSTFSAAFPSPVPWAQIGAGGGAVRGKGWRKAEETMTKPLFSYGFVLGGRMRRITLRRPTLGALKNLVELLSASGSRRSRGNVVWATVGDVVSVAWPALLVWWGVIWCIS